ncbi:folate-binding protein [Buchnera aphidicola (Cinara tujafilina)]|uniref:Folate-binding protein n=1 Tax=Buchnera aphidicola (Cinara tujafilina) TaxID=261317 RepID=F7WZJ0_9GAMM|nr:tRNA-modifying protein YgfZ [Buchnera aphidicola]AEH39857.1 folate-binding protein [Buchnera aphidicola (Cinara tujafilina)]
MTLLNLYNNTVFLNKQLPATIMFLKNWCIVNVTGIDSIQYLNQQFTLDVNTVNHNTYQVGAHCNYNGKVWSPLLLLKYKKDYAYIIQSEIALKQINELKKYSIFSKVDIFLNKNIILFGFAGFGIKNILLNYFSSLPTKSNNIIYYDDVIILRLEFPTERFLMICMTRKSYVFFNSIAKNMLISNDLQWKSLEIESNFPLMNILTCGRFLPQSLNLNYWNAICFNKGCYYGQEVLFRYEKKKINKLDIQILIGKSDILPIVGSSIKHRDKMKNIYNAGIVLASVKLLNHQILLQVCMKKIFCKKYYSFYSSQDHINKFLFFS